MRLFKTVNSTTTDYYYDDAGRLYRAGDVWIFHGPDGSPMSIKYQTVRYYLVKNLQGDVVALTGPNGDIVARYTYDAWGKLLTVTDANGNDISTNAAHIANINPLRYRSYVYDSESGFYYLTSRYYDPTTGRFINMDSQLVTDSGMVGYNPYAYCGNNPVIYVDETGHSFTLAICTITLVTTFFACISPAGLARTDAVLNEPNAYNVGNWLTLGAFDTVKGTFMPEEPLSLQHWIDSAGTASLILPALDSISRASLVKAHNNSTNIISPADATRIQNAANRTNQQITVVGSRASGTATATSDWDYFLFGNSRQRHSAASSLPRGTSGGAYESGIDIFSGYLYDPNRQSLDTSLPHIDFFPKQ